MLLTVKLCKFTIQLKGMTSKVVYKGELRTKSVHLKSLETFITDAPTDNNGKGEAFSPTDMIATNLATCMLTIMGIKARNNNISIINSTAEVLKVMASNPRRISEIQINLIIPTENSIADKDKTILENAALNCPVFHSIHPEIETKVNFNWS